MKNLPHQEPIRFVDKLIEKNSEYALVSCKFYSVPTLAMICEAAAQSSIAFENSKDTKLGFLISLKDIKLKKMPNYKEFIIKISQTITFDTLSEFYFELIFEDEIYSEGSFIVKTED